MRLNYLLFIAAILLLITILVILMILWTKRRTRKQRDHALQLAHDLGLATYKDEDFKRSLFIKSIKLIKLPPIIEGNYKEKALKIFPIIQRTRNNNRLSTAIQIFGSNPMGLSFTIASSNWTHNLWKLINRNRITFGDPAFDKQFIVKSNKPEVIQKILTASLRSQLLIIRKKSNHQSYKGVMTLEDNTLLYIEPHLIETEAKRKRFQALADLMACLRDQIDLCFKEN